MSEKKFLIFDFDGTFYKTPIPQRLEDAIDLAMFRLFMDKIKIEEDTDKALKELDRRFKEFDKSKFTPEELLYFGDKTKPFSAYLNEIKNIESSLMFIRVLLKITEPNGVGNHRVSSMLNLGLNITQLDIEYYYKKYATIDYGNIERNNLIEEIINNAKQNGYLMFIYTDNSKENVLSGMKVLGYNPNDFELIIDMFNCDGGATKKMTKGINAFKKIMRLYCEKNDIEYNLSNFRFYDDNPKICDSMAVNGIESFCVSPTEIRKIETQNTNELIKNMSSLIQSFDSVSLSPC